jgi:hypothetical protein
MNSLWIVLSILLSLSLGVFLAAPLFEVTADGPSGGSLERDIPARLLDAKERALRSLKDLELDYRMGKVSADEFERSKQEIGQEVAQILHELRRYE